MLGIGPDLQLRIQDSKIPVSTLVIGENAINGHFAFS